jgi:glyoxylase-like metal-dependent hydrolase (beta-lactamase superfamily II)
MGFNLSSIIRILMEAVYESYNKYHNVTMKIRNIFFDRLGISGYLIHTPGHTEDSISIVIEGLGVFTGDLPALSNVSATGFSSSQVGRIIEKSWGIIKNTGENRIFPAHASSFEL